MATIEEKLVDMLSTIREIRKNIKENSKVRSYQLEARIERLFSEKHEITQHELFKEFPEISTRTMRRHLQRLVKERTLVVQKNGREVIYRKRETLSTKPSID